MTLYHYFSSIPLPFVSLLLPFCAAFAIFAARLYHKIIKVKTGEAKTINKKMLRMYFLLVFIINVALTLIIWFNFKAQGSTFYVLSSTGWTETMSQDNMYMIKALMQVDAIGALSAVIMGFVALCAALRALTDKFYPLSPTKAGFFILTLCGIQGIFYSNGLFPLFLFILLGQVGASGLYIGVPGNTMDVRRSIWYYISRVIVLAMFFAGALSLFLKYKTDNIAILSTILSDGTFEKTVFILLVVPLFFLFTKPASYVRDSACRCFFVIRAQAAFFVVFRIIFSLFGPMSGLEKIPSLFVTFGVIGLFASLLNSFRDREPYTFVSSIELFLKALMVMALGISLNGMYSAETMAMYGFGAVESMISLWIMYLPLSAVFSIICARLREDCSVCGMELWKVGGLFNYMPLTGVSFMTALCVMSGLPPFAGFAARQFLYRSSYYMSPALMIVIVMLSIAVMLRGVYYAGWVLFVRRGSMTDYSSCSERSLVLPMAVLFLLLIFTTSAPGFFFENCISPSVESLMNRGNNLNIINRGGVLK